MNQKTGPANNDPIAVLAKYQGDKRPIWLWDRRRARILWANIAALRFWGERSAADLSLRDMGADSPLTRSVRAASRQLKAQKRTRQKIVLAPKSKPLPALLDMAPYPIPGYPETLLVVVVSEDAGKPGHSRLDEMFQRIPAPLTLFDQEGQPLLQNRAADTLFGPLSKQAAPPGFFGRMARADHARSLYSTALTSASAARVSTVVTARGPERMRIALSRIADPVSSDIAVLAIYEVVPSLLAIAAPSLRSAGDPVTREQPGSELATANLRGSVMHTLQAAGVGIVTVGRAGNITSFSQGAAAILGIRAADAQDRKFTAYLNAESGHRFSNFLYHGMRDENDDFTRGTEVTGLTKEHQELPLQIYIRPIKGQKRELFCVVLRDLSDWQSALLKIDAARTQAEDDRDIVPQLLANVSHEIRTPMNAILGFAELMQLETFGPVGNEKYKEYLTDIRDSGLHVLSLVNDLLDLSKTEAGRMELNLEDVDVGRIIAASERFVGPQVLGSRITLESHIAPGLPDLRADSRALRQILINLLSNAVRATPKGGRISTNARLNEAGRMVIEIQDSGAGMTEDQIKIALEPYGQLGHDMANRRSGTGLGLPLARALTEAHGAELSISSAPDKGTTVRLVFPMPTR